jgi:hypothetical protein
MFNKDSKNRMNAKVIIDKKFFILQLLINLTKIEIRNLNNKIGFLK